MQLPAGSDLLEYRRPLFIVAESLSGYARKMFDTLPVTWVPSDVPGIAPGSWVSSGNFNQIKTTDRLKVKADLELFMAPINLMTSIGIKPMSQSEIGKYIASQPLNVGAPKYGSEYAAQTAQFGTIPGFQKAIQQSTRKKKRKGLGSLLKKIGRFWK